MQLTLCFIPLGNHIPVTFKQTRRLNDPCKLQLWRYICVPSKRKPSRSSRFLDLSCSGVIFNTGSGGHAFIGYHLSSTLQQKGVQITLWNQQLEEKRKDSQPFSHYAALEALGVNTLFSNSAVDSLKGKVKRCDWILDK